MANQDIYTYDPTLQAAQYARQQKMAELMQQQADQPIDIQSYNGIQAPISWGSVLAKGLKAGLGSYLSGEATKGEAGLSKAETADALAKIGQLYKLPDTTGLAQSAEPAGTTPTPYNLSMPTFTENAKSGQPTGSQDFTANLNMPNMPGVTTATIPGAARPYAEQQQMLNEFALGGNRKLAAMAPVLAAQLKPEYKEVGANGLVRIDPNTGKAITVVGPKPPAPSNKTPFAAVGKDGKAGMFVYDETGNIVPVPGMTPFRTGGNGGENTKLSTDDLDFMARQALTGDTSVFAGLGYGSAGAQNRSLLRSKITQVAKELKIKPEDVAALNAQFFGTKAGERTLGTRTANIGMAVAEATKLMPLALAASEKVNRTQFPTLNSILMAGEKGVGDENVVRLGVATNSLINTYARAINPTGIPTVSDKDHARELLVNAWSKGQYAAGVNQLKLEMDAAKQSPGIVREEFRTSISGTTPAQAAPGPGAGGAYSQLTDAQIKEQLGIK